MQNTVWKNVRCNRKFSAKNSKTDVIIKGGTFRMNTFEKGEKNPYGVFFLRIPRFFFTNPRKKGIMNTYVENYQGKTQ